MLYACFTGYQHLVVGNQWKEMEETLNRVLLYSPTLAMLDAQSVFLSGGNFYMDFVLGGSGKSKGGSGVFAHAMARFESQRGQMAFHVPYESFAAFRLPPN